MAKNDKFDRKKNLRPPIAKGERRAEKEFNRELFEFLCRLHCTENEVMAGLGFKSHHTLVKNCKAVYGTTFEEVYKSFRDEGNISLRRQQWKSAEDGNVNMQKWLGIQYLNQKDKQEIDTKQDHTLEIRRTIIHRTAEEFRQDEKQPRTDDN